MTAWCRCCARSRRPPLGSSEIEVRQRHVGRALEGMSAKRSAREVAANVKALRTAVAAADDPAAFDVSTMHRIHRTLLPEEP